MGIPQGEHYTMLGYQMGKKSLHRGSWSKSGKPRTYGWVRGEDDPRPIVCREESSRKRRKKKASDTLALRHTKYRALEVAINLGRYRAARSCESQISASAEAHLGKVSTDRSRVIGSPANRTGRGRCRCGGQPVR